MKKSILCLMVASLLFSCPYAQEQPDSAVVQQNSGAPWRIGKDSIQLTRQSFDVSYGTEDIYFTGQIHLEPLLIFYQQTDGLHLDIQPHATAIVQEDVPLGNRLWLTYRLARQHLDYPEQHIESIRVKFDKGNTIDFRNGMIVPADVKRIMMIEIKWKGSELPVTRVMQWGRVDIPSKRWLWLAGIGALGVGGILYGRLRRNKKPGQPEEKQEDEKQKKVVLSFTRIDPALPFDTLHPWNLIRVKAVFSKAPSSDKKARLASSTGDNIEVALSPLTDAVNTFISEPILVTTPVDDAETEDTGRYTLNTDVPGTLTVTVDEDSSTIPLSWPELPELPDPKGIRILINGPQNITVDPQAGVDGLLSIKVIDEFDNPVPDARIIWDIEGYTGDSPLTIADEEGITTLGFVASSEGGFIATMDDLPLIENIPATQLKINPLPDEMSMVELLSQEPPEFTADLVAPTFVRILDNEHSSPSFLYEGQPVHFTITPGRAHGGSNAATISVTVTDPHNKIHSITLNKSDSAGVYRNEKPWLVPHKENGDKLTLEFSGQRIELPVYANQVKGQEVQLYPMINQLRQLNLAARQSPDLDNETRQELHLKGKMIANAQAWLDEPQSGLGVLIVAIINAYIELLEQPWEELGPMQDIPVDIAVMPAVYKNTRIVYACKAESDKINEIISRTIQRSMSAIYWGVLKIIVELIAAPHIGAYTAYTGLDLEGRKVGKLERFIGGVTAVMAILPVGLAFARYARAARALERKALSNFRLLSTTMQKAYSSRIFVVKAATTQQLRAQMSGMFTKTIKAEIKIQKQAQKALDKVDDLKRQIKELEDEIQAAQTKLDDEIQWRAESISKGNKRIKPMTADMRNWKNGIVKKQKSLELQQVKLQKAKANHAEHIKNLNELHVGRDLTRNHLKRLKDENILPAECDKIEGRRATDLYQVQAQADLAATDAAWAGVTKRTIHNPYRQTRWGKIDDFKISRKKTIAPEADHINMKDLNGADSKYWTFWPEKSGKLGKDILKDLDTVTHRVRQAVNSIEKGRQIQYNILSQRTGQQGMKVWKEVWDLDFAIITPVEVPLQVQNMIRASVGGAGSKIRFQVVPARLDAWASSIP
jgi:hypothetical protein